MGICFRSGMPDLKQKHPADSHSKWSNIGVRLTYRDFLTQDAPVSSEQVNGLPLGVDTTAQCYNLRGDLDRDLGHVRQQLDNHAAHRDGPYRDQNTA